MSKVKIFSGEDSVEIWHRINSAKTIRDLTDVLYAICCKLQEFESRVEELQKKVVPR